jgi:hypothetical protein
MRNNQGMHTDVDSHNNVLGHKLVDQGFFFLAIGWNCWPTSFYHLDSSFNLIRRINLFVFVFLNLFIGI